MADPILTVKELEKTFRSGERDLVVFSGLNLAIAEGERIAIVGESGAGKSTLLYLLGGLDRPSKGTIYFGQRAITTLSDRDLADYRNRQVGFVWQNHSLLPEFSAAENVAMPLMIRGVAREEAMLSARARLNEVGLANREEHRAGELSGGEQQRVALARALASNPRLLLADEPTGNLDAKTGEMVMGLLEEVQRQQKLTLIFVTHNPAYASRADRIIEMYKSAQSIPAGVSAPVDKEGLSRHV